MLTAFVSGTDVPFDFALPSVSSVSKSSVEEIREWVLAASMDQKIDTTKGHYDANLRDPATGKARAACIVTVKAAAHAPHLRARVS